MLKKFITITATLFVWGLAAQEYADVPTASERQNDSRFFRFPNWKTIEVIKNGQKKDMAQLINPNEWNQDIKVDKLEWLELQNLDLYTAGIKTDKDKTLVPFVLDLRYKEGGNFGQLMQGTINTQGNLIVSTGLLPKALGGQLKVDDVQIVKYYDSQPSEEQARRAGMTNKYDNRFVKNVVTSALKQYFSDSNNANALRSLIQQVQEGQED